MINMWAYIGVERDKKTNIGVERENSQKLLIGEYIKRNEMKQNVNEIL